MLTTLSCWIISPVRFPHLTAEAVTKTPVEVPQRLQSMSKHDKQFYSARLLGYILIITHRTPEPSQKKQKNKNCYTWDGIQPNTQTGLPMLYYSKTILYHIKDRLFVSILESELGSLFQAGQLEPFNQFIEKIIWINWKGQPCNMLSLCNAANQLGFPSRAFYILASGTSFE